MSANPESSLREIFVKGDADKLSKRVETELSKSDPTDETFQRYRLVEFILKRIPATLSTDLKVNMLVLAIGIQQDELFHHRDPPTRLYQAQRSLSTAAEPPSIETSTTTRDPLSLQSLYDEAERHGGYPADTVWTYDVGTYSKAGQGANESGVGEYTVVEQTEIPAPSFSLESESDMFSNTFLEIKSHPLPNIRYGIFARTSIKPGTTMLEEAPLCRAKKSEFSKYLAYEALSEARKTIFHKLQGQCPCGDEETCKMPPIMKIWCTNSFGCNNYARDSSSIFYIASHFNHSCVPSGVWDITSEGHIRIVADKEIDVGEEITLSYIDTVGSARKRRDCLAKAWGFICRCEACEAGITIASEMQGKWPKSDPKEKMDSHVEGLLSLEEVIEIKRREAKLVALIDHIGAFHHHLRTQVETLLSQGASSKKVREAALLAVVWEVENLLHEAFPGINEQVLQGYLSKITQLHLCVLHLVHDPVCAVERYFHHIELVLL
ncbi:SET domain-containing protein [Acephala macrosclerotiorum]|nr:SET domain-containing protein [Acephala macrosclerotiorum]